MVVYFSSWFLWYVIPGSSSVPGFKILGTTVYQHDFLYVHKLASIWITTDSYN